jgi:DNA-binding MarR family transcriptional regulator
MALVMPEPREQRVEQIADLLHEIVRGLSRGHRHPPGDLDITIGQLHCLKVIRSLGTPSMTDLSDILQLQPSTVTALVDGLVERELVERHEDAEDRRIVRVALTTEGKRRGTRHRKARRQRLLELLGGIDDADLERIEDALEVLHAAAVRRAADGDGPGASRPEENE